MKLTKPSHNRSSPKSHLIAAASHRVIWQHDQHKNTCGNIPKGHLTLTNSCTFAYYTCAFVHSDALMKLLTSEAQEDAVKRRVEKKPQCLAKA